MTLSALLAEGEISLREAEIAEAGLDARLLLEYIFGIDHAYLLLHGNEEVSDLFSTNAAKKLEEDYRNLITRRSMHIPLQQLTGTQNFMGLTLVVNEDVLIPRQDTETLVEEALKELHDGMRILDLCTGSGCILLSLLHYSNDCEGVGTDLSERALKVARENADKIFGADKEKRSRITFLRSDLYERIEGTFDLVISNPPYIPTATIEDLAPEVRDHDPRIALDGGPDGLSFYRRIIEGLSDHLIPGGTVLFEIGYDQADTVSSLLEQAGYKYIEVMKDLSGLDRVVKGRKPILNI